MKDVGHDRADAVIDLGSGVQVPTPYQSRLRNYRSPDVRYITLNTSRPLFSSARERRAVAMAINRAAVTHFNPSWLPTESLLPKGGARDSCWWFSREVEPGSAPRRSRQRTAIYLTCNQSTCIQQATLVARELALIGIHVVVKSLPGSALFLKVSTPGAAYDITDLGWTTGLRRPRRFPCAPSSPQAESGRRRAQISPT